MKSTEQVAPCADASKTSYWLYALIIVVLIYTLVNVLMLVEAEMRMEENRANEAVIASTVAVPGMPYRIRESVTRLPSGRCATVIERFELWNGRYLKIPEVSVHARTEHPCE